MQMEMFSQIQNRGLKFEYERPSRKLAPLAGKAPQPEQLEFAIKLPLKRRDQIQLPHKI